ncbi:MAG: nitroreductase/quinone reductase family protein [Candidatus Dormibacteria bacterium]
MGPWGDHLILMTARSAKGGGEVTTPLLHRRENGAYVVVASKGGAPDNPQWYDTILVNPEVEVEVAAEGGTEHFRARARVAADGEERDRLYEHMTGVWPAFRDYAQEVERTIPVVILDRID